MVKILLTQVLFDKNNKTQGHLFFNLDRELNIDDFNKSNLKLNFEQVSDDTYLKANKLLLQLSTMIAYLRTLNS